MPRSCCRTATQPGWELDAGGGCREAQARLVVVEPRAERTELPARCAGCEPERNLEPTCESPPSPCPFPPIPRHPVRAAGRMAQRQPRSEPPGEPVDPVRHAP